MLEAWLLSRAERGNDATTLDRGVGEKAWTRGNRVEVLVHGREYFARLYDVLCELRAGDWVHFTDWRADPDQRLAGPGTEVARVLADLARRHVQIRGLVWRSHPDQAHFSEQENLHLVETVNDAGGEVLLDERVRRGGSHHQKLFVVRHAGAPERDVAFVGGIDLCHGRGDDERHQGDDQAIDIDDAYGARPPWHDIQLEVRGPAVADLARTFRERWADPTPLERQSPWRRWFERAAREPARPGPLPPVPPDPAPSGTSTVQVLRTYPSRRPRYPFAPRGERSIARAYLKAFGRARRLIYVEDQYLWCEEGATALADALRHRSDLRVIAVVPRYPDQNGVISGPLQRIGQERALRTLRDGGGERFAVYDLEARPDRPVYVHAKICVVDDVWMTVGSDNLNRRSWTHDSELSCAVVDDQLDEREPSDPGGLGDGARALARATRLRLWREHLDRDVDDDADLLDPVTGFDAWRATATALDRWHAEGRRGDRPPGRVRDHRPSPVRTWQTGWARLGHRLFVDPDGRPPELRRARRF